MVKKAPTVKPFDEFNAKTDIEKLKKAMKGLGTDEAAIIDVLTKRSNQQRQKLIAEYKSSFGKDLLKELKSELSGNFERTVLALMTPPEDFLATEINQAVAGAGTDEGSLVDILGSCTNEEIKEVAQAYKRLFDKSLESAVAGDTSGDFKSILVALCQGARSESDNVDEEKAKEDAEKLYKAGTGKLGTDESEFIRVICTSSYAHLREVQHQYKKLTQKSLKDAVKSEFNGNIQRVIITILSCAKDKSKYFAERLNHAMAGAGTKDRQLIRILVSRSEIDLADIQIEFQKKYEKTLEAAIKSEASGDYKKILLALI